MNIVIQTIKFLAAISIVIFHYSPVRSVLVNNLNVVIGLFFVLSGFLLQNSDSKKDNFKWNKFYLNRIVRIMPSYWIVLVPYLLDSEASISVKIVHLLLLQSWAFDSSLILGLNSPTWFLSVIVFCYLLYPVLRRLNVKNLSFLQYGIFVLLLVNSYNDYLFYFPVFHLQLFIYGIKLAMTKRIVLEDWVFSILLVAAYLITEADLLLHNGILYLVWGHLLILAMRKLHFIVPEGVRICLNLLGNSSYAIFLLQAPFYAFAVRTCGTIDLWLFFFYVLLLLLLSVAFTRLIKRFEAGLVAVLFVRRN